MGEQSSSFTMAPKSFAPWLLLHRIRDTTSSALTVLSMDVMAGGDRTAAATDLVALVDAVDELRVRGCPRKTDGCRVDRLGLHIARGDGRYWGWTRRGRWKGRQRGRKGSARKKEKWKDKKRRCQRTFRLTAGSLPASILMSVLIAAAQVRADTVITLFLMTLKPNTRALCGFVCDCASCLWILEGCLEFVWSVQRRVNANAVEHQSALAFSRGFQSAMKINSMLTRRLVGV